jgi:hypothetical protein
MFPILLATQVTGLGKCGMAMESTLILKLGKLIHNISIKGLGGSTKGMDKASSRIWKANLFTEDNGSLTATMVRGCFTT